MAQHMLEFLGQETAGINPQCRPQDFMSPRKLLSGVHQHLVSASSEPWHGRHRCSTKARQGARGRRSLPVPMEKLDRAVVDHVEWRLLV